VGLPTAAAPSGAAARIRIDSRRRWLPDLRAVVRARQLLFLLNRRDITVRYRQTVLGAIWIVVSPLLSAGLFTFVFGRVAKLPSDGLPYFAFSYAGLLGWNLFSDTLLSGSRSLVGNSNLITKIYFPRLVLPISTMASTLVNTGISFVVMLVILFAYRIPLTINLLVLPVWLMLAIALGVGIGLVLTSVSVTYRDVNYVTPALMPLLLYVTPVAYSVNAVPANLRGFYLLNPLATIVEGCRWSLLGSGYLVPAAIVYTFVVTAASLVIGLIVFTRLEWGFADVI
jgi:lipopolysaccharide transport system permease protein